MCSGWCSPVSAPVRCSVCSPPAPAPRPAAVWCWWPGRRRSTPGPAAFGFVAGPTAAIVVAAVIGIGEAYLGVVLIAWLQYRVPEEMRGRVMSLVAFAVVALDPLSYALAGALLPAGTTVTFTVCGGDRPALRGRRDGRPRHPAPRLTPLFLPDASLALLRRPHRPCDD